MASSSSSSPPVVSEPEPMKPLFLYGGMAILGTWFVGSHLLKNKPPAWTQGLRFAAIAAAFAHTNYQLSEIDRIKGK